MSTVRSRYVLRLLRGNLGEATGFHPGLTFQFAVRYGNASIKE